MYNNNIERDIITPIKYSIAAMQQMAPNYTPNSPLLHESTRSPYGPGEGNATPIAMQADNDGHGTAPYPDNLPVGLCEDFDRSCTKAKALPDTWWNGLSPAEKRAVWMQCRHQRRTLHDWWLTRGKALHTVTKPPEPETLPRHKGVLQLAGVIASRGSSGAIGTGPLTSQLATRERRLAAYAVALTGAPAWLDGQTFSRWLLGETPHSIARDPDMPTDKSVLAAMTAAMQRIRFATEWQPLCDAAEIAEGKITPLAQAERQARKASAKAEYSARRITARDGGDAIRRSTRDASRPVLCAMFSNLYDKTCSTKDTSVARDAIVTKWLLDNGAIRSEIIANRDGPYPALPRAA